MASTSPVAAVFGCTGLVGSNILSTLLAAKSTAGTVHTVSRRQPKAEGPKLRATIEPSTEQWAAKLAALQPPPTTVYSAVGTTRAAAGGLENQRKIDHDLNVEIAKAAKKAGAKTFVFISSAGTRGMLAARAPYSQMKIGVEDTIKELDFDHAVIVRPGLIMGQREESRTAEGLLQGFFNGLGKLSTAAKDFMAQDADVIARAAVAAAVQAEQGKAPSKYWILEQADIIRLGRTEWKDFYKELHQPTNPAITVYRDNSVGTDRSSTMTTARPSIVGPDSGPEPPFPYKMEGKVISGFGRGSKELGIPTANLPVDATITPWISSIPSGVYYGWASLQLPPSHPESPSPPDTTTPSSSPSPPYIVFPMVMSIGYNPFYNNTERSAEVHILHKFTADFYDAPMRLLILGFIREEKNYDSLEALVKDINTDCDVARASLDRKAWVPRGGLLHPAVGVREKQGDLDGSWLVRSDDSPSV
ncbi:uncharacterized protein PpBr36_06109 [Pyricularia pennisetigena]|uniref:uncharacterized protein n=1 Tax=Pyricularia pennisetigena TaxID=1578925 RepID=UPI0011521C8F|nr:uncharacterized protein PpBr36_06109 [Pyricularia pennisetigena]TLS22587.1 hypothetical protein PpBr36_06109 [Pyricularia pennisetigena]